MQTINTSATPDSGGNVSSWALPALTFLFFIWGFITCLNDILIPHLKAVFDLNYTQAMLIQFCFFGAYFLVSLPAGALINRVGYQKGIVLGLTIAGIGTLNFLPAASFHSYAWFLAALFVLASGITILQVAANPYVTVLGSEKTASSRLTMTQAFNSLGTTVAPLFGALLILSEFKAGDDAGSVQLPYLILTVALFAVAFIFSRLNLPVVRNTTAAEKIALRELLPFKHLLLGAVGIFVYVGAEVAIGSTIVNFIGLPEVAGLKESEAAHYVAWYWGGAMIGRFVGAVLMQRINAGLLLAFNAVAAIVLLIVAMTSLGSVGLWALLAIGLANSIMFPTIFSLALQGLDKYTGQGAGLLCLAIVGGAIVPVLQGMMADSLGLVLSYMLPLLCYIFIVFYGLSGHKVKR
ncbi:sugar MFS transporter [Rheinheimera sp. YQF-2]|uniref:Sugar MFS transporter n=1 Tax=Rheinheimera lutimaris TaxID=2740584 RepID=A0A7Y5APL6_9GAMM|nr:sugar MFS transporter [Rheinheimera lutimaris]NRQ41750.1 sugar MFS transporter [Rheinheimera lutimaris]